MKPIPTPVFSSRASGPVTMAWMLMPLRPGAALPVERCDLVAAETGEAAVITFADGRSHVLLLRHEEGMTISAGNVTSTGEITLVERRPDGTEQRLVTFE